MWACFPTECLQRISCLFHVWTIHGVCPTNHRQWADSLVSLAALLHRQYKTARTELAVISYWKQGRWRLRQRLRAVMFCSSVPQGTHGNPKIVCGLRTHPRSAPNLERHRTRCPTRHGRNPRILLQRIAAPVAFWNFIFSDILIIKHIPFQIFLVRR